MTNDNLCNLFSFATKIFYSREDEAVNLVIIICHLRGTSATFKRNNHAMKIIILIQLDTHHDVYAQSTIQEYINNPKIHTLHENLNYGTHNVRI
jgi:hypothetical protein